jgi:hypothetical protein
VRSLGLKPPAPYKLGITPTGPFTNPNTAVAISAAAPHSHLLPAISFFVPMAASHPKMFKSSSTDESEIRKLVDDHLLPPRAILQWRPVKDEEIPTPNTNEIMVSKSFFERVFELPASDFFRDLLNHFKIELIHLNPISILQITVVTSHP